jgi:hypothetical protein
MNGHVQTEDIQNCEANVPTVQKRYKWRTGDCLMKYGASARIWNEYSSTDEFKAAF